VKLLRELLDLSILLESNSGGLEHIHMGVRRQAREIALQALYMIDFNDHWNEYLPGSFFNYFEAESSSKNFAEILIQGVLDNRSKLDSVITRASENWSIQRMARVDRSLLRVSCFELCCLPDVPKNVSINEAVEIAKRFGSEDSPMFINGVLDKISFYIDQVTKNDSSKNFDLSEVKDHQVQIKVRA